MVGFIEKAVPQSCTNQDTEETVDVEWGEELILDLLLLIQAFVPAPPLQRVRAGW